MTIRNWNFALESPKSGEEAYVGLREKGDKVTLRVPHGYPIDLTGDKLSVHEKQQILGELTCAVMRFSAAFSKKVDRSIYDGRSTRDGWLKADGGQSFNFDDPAHGYTHLDRYYKLISMLRDPRLLAITKAPGLTAQFDHRYIARNLERAMFLADGTPVFDLSWAPRTQMRHTGNDMVGLACWMALDAVKILFPNSADHQIAAVLQSEWEELAHRFADEHELDADASLFSDKRKDTLPLLQTALETCVRLAPLVSSDARELHHLLDELLHYALSGQDGDIWGLQGFYHVWESVCLEHAIAQYGIDKIFTCDDTFLPDIDQSIRNKWKDNQRLVFARNGIARCPDLVIETKEGNYLIVDFKYYAEEESEKFVKERPSTPNFDLCKKDDNFCKKVKAYQDIASIEAYRWLLMQHEINPVGRALAQHLGLKPDLQSIDDESRVTLELWVPGKKYKKYLLCWQAWEDNKPLGDPAKFGTLAYKHAREIIGAYASKFDLMG